MCNETALGVQGNYLFFHAQHLATDCVEKTPSFTTCPASAEKKDQMVTGRISKQVNQSKTNYYDDCIKILSKVLQGTVHWH
jgi:hypothetical protein